MSRALGAVVLLAVILHGVVAALPGPLLMDFGSFIASGQAVGQGLDPYGIYPLTFRVELPGFESWNPNLNPPPSLPLFQALAGLDPVYGFRLWWAASLLCFAATVWLLASHYGAGMRVLWAFALAGLWDTLALGQIYLPLVLAATGAWLLLAKGQGAAAGLLIGLVVAVKPNFVVWPVLLWLAGYPRPATVAVVIAAGLATVPLALYGPEVYTQWVGLVLRDEHRAIFLTNASLAGLAQRLGVPAMGALASLTLLGGLAWWVRRKRLPALHASALGLVGAVLASPIAWVHYTLFLLPVFFALPSSPALLLAAAALVVPVPLVLALLEAPWWAQATAGSVYAWAMVVCLLALIRLAGHTAPEGGGAREEGAR